MTTDRLCELTDLTEKARHMTRAAAELMQADSLISCNDLHDGDEQKQLKIWDLLRTHDTCASLLFSLLDIFDRLDTEIDGAEQDEMNAKKPDGIQSTETTPPKKCANARKS